MASTYKLPYMNYGTPASGISNFGGVSDPSNPFLALSASASQAAPGTGSTSTAPDWSSVQSGLASVGLSPPGTKGGVEAFESAQAANEEYGMGNFADLNLPGAPGTSFGGIWFDPLDAGRHTGGVGWNIDGTTDSLGSGFDAELASLLSGAESGLGTELASPSP